MPNGSRPLPQRRCVACGRQAPKRELVRIVRSPAGQVIVDPRGKAAGRGAYVCRDRVCWEAALAKGRLGHSLKVALSPEQRQQLQEALGLLGLAGEAQR